MTNYAIDLSKNCSKYQDGLGVHIGLFRNVQNTGELLDKKIQENAAFLDASVVLTLEQLLIAINKTLYLNSIGKNRMKSFFAEILYNLSISKNITESLKQFGIEKLKDEKSTNLIVITIDKTDTKPELFNKINGELHLPTNENLFKTCDQNLIKKIYKTDNCSIIESKIASKEFLN